MSESTPTHEVEHSARPEDTPRAVGPLFGDEPPTRGAVFLRELMRGSAMTTVLAIVLAMIVGGVLIASTNKEVQAAAGYFFARPGDTLVAIWNAVIGGYEALFRGAVFNPRGNDFAAPIRPLTNSLGFAAPLIAGISAYLCTRLAYYITRRNAMVSAVTQADIRRAAERTLGDGRMLAVAAGRPTGF